MGYVLIELVIIECYVHIRTSNLSPVRRKKQFRVLVEETSFPPIRIEWGLPPIMVEWRWALCAPRPAPT